MHYKIVLVWNSTPKHISFDPVAVRFSPLARYEEIRSGYLREHGIILPETSPEGWTCSLLLDDVLYMHVKFSSELEAVPLQKQLDHSLVPEFADRIEVKPVYYPPLSVLA